MLRVIIADDEPKVNLLLQKIVDWESLGYEIVGTANDGIRALQLIGELQPDLVLTDIRMPGCDGLELIRQSRELDPKVNFIVVSGYRQFDYARTALKYGVEDYLLKPVKEEELTALLGQIREKMEQHQEQEQWKADAARKIQQDEERKKEQLVRLLKDYAKKGADFLGYQEINREYGCHFGEGIYLAMVIKPDIPQEKENLDSYRIMMRRSRDIVQRHLEEMAEESAAAVEDEGIAVIIYNQVYDHLQLSRTLTRIRKDIENLRDLFWGITVTAASGYPCSRMEELPGSMNEAMGRCKDRIFRGKGTWIGSSDKGSGMPERESFTLEPGTRKYIQELGEYLEPEKLRQEIQRLEVKLVSGGQVSGQKIYECFVEVVDACMNGIRQNGRFDEEAAKKDLLFRYHMCTSQGEIFSLLQESLEEIMKQHIQMREQTEMRPILDAKRYIQEHFQEPLKLEDVSREIGFNATYFSSVFKKETGKNFSDYLTELRMSRAKQLLCSKELSVNDVAEAVGYQDIKYFSKLFKKAAGISPSEYKKLYQ